ncbi:von Willebrand factor type A domain protein [compost metagenome]
MAGPNTAIGDAIGLALKLFAKADEPDKVLILLTDGNDTASAITPEHAAQMAAAKGIIIHTIGIGDPTASGEARVNLDTLQKIAEATGGRFFRAEDRAQLDEVYASLDRLTPHQVKTLSHQPKLDLFWWPLGAALGVLLLGHLIAALAARVSTARASNTVEG